MNRLHPLVLTVVFSFFSLFAQAQISSGGTPLSFTPEFQEKHGDRLRTHRVERLNVSRAKEAEEVRPGFSFTEPVRVDLGLMNAGQWTELEDGSFMWRLKIQSRGALALAVLYDEFYLPPGATLYMYSEDRQQLLGAYSYRNNRPGGKFMTGLIEGESAILEYHEPAAVAGQGQLHLFRVDRAFRPVYKDAANVESRSPQEGETGFGASLDCHENANCAAGDSWENQKKSVCRIIVVVEEGMGFCTGTLMNNTRQDGTPYLLSAYHCQDGYTPLYDFWRFDFGYRSPFCSDPGSEPVPRSVLGADPVAGRQENDLLLLKLQTVIPSTFDVYYAGWDRREAVPAAAVNFHHPVGDIMKVATIDGGITIFPGTIDWNNGVVTPANHHFDSDYSTGTFELGSSGSALFNQNGLVVGQLHGGNPESCTQTQAWYGRLALAWEGGGSPQTRLRDWLDPLNTGTELMPGTAEPDPGFADLSGMVRTETGDPLVGVEIDISNLDGTIQRTAFTDQSGRYTFDNLPLQEFYSLIVSRKGDDNNGVSTFDLIQVRKHILGIERLDSPYKMLAADVNLSGGITTLDLIKTQKVILGVSPGFDETESWQFLRGNFIFTDPTNPFLDDLPTQHFLPDFTNEVTDLDFTGVKNGDVNGSAYLGL